MQGLIEAMNMAIFRAFAASKFSALLASFAIQRRETRAHQAVLMLCHALTDATRKEFERISKKAVSVADCLILLHQKREEDSGPLQFRNYIVTDESLAKLPYKWLFEAKVVPGSTHFPLMEFFSKFPDYEYYWLVEDDVKFFGNWKRFFDAFAMSREDFVACYIRKYDEEPAWYWWPTLTHPTQEIPLTERLASFNPIYRISKRALAYLHQKHCEGWCGHFELLIPTLLFHGGFQLRDIGGGGQFVVPGEKNRFYTTKTFRHAPPFRQIGWRKNKLYHPVKCPLNVGRTPW